MFLNVLKVVDIFVLTIFPIWMNWYGPYCHFQGAWAYKYWDAELNIQQNIEHIVTLLKDIVAEELKELSTEYSRTNKNPITYWAPEQAEIQADLALPFEMKNLQSGPDFSPLVKKVEKVANDVAVYLPDQKTLDGMKQVRFNQSILSMWLALDIFRCFKKWVYIDNGWYISEMCVGLIVL